MMNVGHLSHHVVVGPGSHMGLESGASKHFHFHFSDRWDDGKWKFSTLNTLPFVHCRWRRRLTMTSDYNMLIFKKKKLKKMMELRTTSSKSVTIICRKDQQYHQIFWITWNKVYKLRVRKLKWGGTGRNITQYFQSSIWIANLEVSKETLVCKIVIVMKADGYSLRRRGRPTTHPTRPTETLNNQVST